MVSVLGSGFFVGLSSCYVDSCIFHPRYVLSPTHLHEFRSTDRMEWCTPVMSLYLPEQRLGTHSQPGSTSHKFMLKGRQTGAMRRGHSWVFRAESYETMMAWYEDIENLMRRNGATRDSYVKRHYRSASSMSAQSAVTHDQAIEEDEADRTPYSADRVVTSREPSAPASEVRPQPGGRFLSDVQIGRHVHDPLLPSSGESSVDRDLTAVADSACGKRQQSVSDRGDDAGPIAAASRATDSLSRRSVSHYGDSVPEKPNSLNDVGRLSLTDEKSIQTTEQQENESTIPTTDHMDFANEMISMTFGEDHHELIPAPITIKRTQTQRSADSKQELTQKQEQTPLAMEKQAVATVAESATGNSETTPEDAETSPVKEQQDGKPVSGEDTFGLQIPGQFPPHVLA